jgi:hypothetical protein
VSNENIPPLLQESTSLKTSTGSTSKKSVAPGSKGIRLVVVSFLLFITIGNFIFPVWWWEFLFRYGFSKHGYWIGGIDSIFGIFLIPSLVACTLLYLEQIVFKTKNISSSLKRQFNNLKNFILENNRYVVFFLVGCLIASLITLKDRNLSSRLSYRDRLEKTISESIVSQDKVPLEQPSRFIFLSTKVIDSLYTQREDSLAIAKVTEEVQASRNLKGEVKFTEIFKTDAEKNDAQKRMTEYQTKKKTPEQQIKDLVGYLYKTKSIASYGFQPYRPKWIAGEQIIVRAGDIKSTETIRDRSENEEIDAAIQVLEKYNLFVDQEKLKKVRGRLLATDIQALESELRNIQGQIIVVGNWSIQLRNDIYTFKRSFIDQISESPTCEFKLPKSFIIPESKLIIDDTVNSGKGTTIKLGVFGTVTSSVTGKTGKVALDPIAVYLP